MGIFQRQYQKILSQEFLKYFLLGTTPNAQQISSQIKEALGKDGKTTFQFVPQLNNEVFNIYLYNKALRQIKFDIDTFQEELFDLFKESYKRINYADLYNKVHSYQLSQLQKRLETILFTTENADFYFLGIFDTFSDLSKTNQDISTPNIVNLSEQALALPFGSRGTSKIKSAHMLGVQTWPVTVIDPVESILIKNAQVAGTEFQNIFVDTISSWTYEVLSRQEGRAEIRIRFPIAGLDFEEKEVFLNRIELISHSTDKQTVIVKVSSDNVNYLPINGYEQGVILEDPSIVYSLDFETNLVQYIELTFIKERSDNQIGENNQKQFQYLFGLKNISCYKTGRFNKGVYQSKPFEIGSDGETISRVSLQSEAIIPANTSINYSVALQKDDGSLTNFIPIKPIGTKGGIGIPEVVNFGTDIQNNKFITVINNNASTYGSPFQGKYFYRIGEKIEPEPIFGSGRLFRGFKGWYRDSTRGFEIKEIKDVFVSFAQSDIEAMYDIKTEVPQFTNLSATERKVQLTLTRPPYYVSSRGHALVPENRNLSNNISPNYAIYSVQQVSSKNRRREPFQISQLRVQLPTTNYILYSSIPGEEPNIEGYQRGVDYILETETFGDSEKPTGYIIIPATSSLVNSSGQLNDPTKFLVFEWTPDPDITHKVEKIEGNTVTLNNAFVDPYSNLQIEYRFIPTAPSEIIKASIRVSDAPTSSPTIDFYVEGKDYAVDPGTGNIQRIPTGDIASEDSVYIQFSYRDSENAVETFQTWCYVNADNGIQIKFDLDETEQKNNLIIDEEVGESFFLNTPQGLIDLSRASSTPIINRGWVQFIVRSKNPDANTTYGTNLIDQIIQMRDQDKKKVFKFGNQYFKEITAFRNALTQKTLNHLKVNTLASDRSVFAIDNETEPTESYIVINFKPGNTEDFYNREPTNDQIADDRPPEFDEVFRFLWSSKSIDKNLGNKLIVRIELERNSNASESGTTPKVLEYSIRASL